MTWFYKEGAIGEGEKRELMARLVEKAGREGELRRVLLLPPDFTRYHSGVGQLTEMLYQLLPAKTQIDIIPTLGQHQPMTGNEIHTMYGSIPPDRFYVHNWRTDCARLGTIDREFVRDASEGRADFSIPIELNRRMTEGNYDLIVSLGHVVPHEVLGFANYNKNIYIGIGGKDTLNLSHFLSASYGIEQNLGRIIPPLRRVYNEADRRFLKDYPIVYVLVVTEQTDNGDIVTSGLYVGKEEDTYLRAAELSRRLNVTILDHPLQRAVTFMDGAEFKSTWVANKAIYRTRMAIADGGELLVIAPGVKRFGETEEIDVLIRKYGYKGTPMVTEAIEKDPKLRDFLLGAAHLIHGSSEGRFTITYAPGGLSRDEIEGVGYRYMSLEEAMSRYPSKELRDGKNMLEDEELYYISSPASGLWAWREQFAS